MAFNSKFNGTVRYSKETRTYHVSCEICWEGPKGKWGQGYASNIKEERRAVAAVKNHIRRTHGVKPIVRVGGIIDEKRSL